jgi:exopolyphosphatase/guanosine-5'-triphosphate,3'-diphosphate pyrophosphatase
VLARSGTRELITCSWALREGLLLELTRATSARCTAEARRRSVEALAARFADSNQHGRQVAKLALALFDALAPELRLGPRARELLEYAALLHDIGHAIDHDRHDRHSYYLIKNAELFGFDPIEVEVVAQAARGHRKQAPKADASDGRALGREDRRTARALAAILRIADALDRSHFGVVKGVEVVYKPGRLVVEVDSVRAQADLELWACETRKDLLAKLLGSRVIVRAQATAG